MNKFDIADKKITKTIEIQKEFKDEVSRKMISTFSTEAAKMAKTKKIYLLICTDK